MGKKNFQPEAEQSLSEILQIRRDKLTALQEAGRDPFTVTKYTATHTAADVTDRFEELEGQEVSVAGRLMSKRGMGKVSFCDLQDKSGRVQLYVRKDLIGEEEYSWFKKCDIGDIVGVKGEVFKTNFRPRQRGEAAGQEPASPARKVPRPDRPRNALSSALCGSDRQSRCAQDLRAAL